MPVKPRLTFATYQTIRGSTVVGRILPLVYELKEHYTIQLHLLKSDNDQELPDVQMTYIGYEPFVRTSAGKQRYTGFKLVWTMLRSAIVSAYYLIRQKPDVIVLVKSLPTPVLAVWLGRLVSSRGRVILDVDDFELTANHLTSLLQRSVIHWSERTAARLAHTIVAATPFLVDHFTQLTQQKVPIHLLPTSYSALPEKPRYSESTESSQLLYIGSLSISSGHRVDLLPEILELVRHTVPQAKLLLAGTGDDIEKLKDLFAERGLTQATQWVGRFSTANIAHLLKQSSLIIDPVDDSLANRAKSSFRISLAATEGWPVVTSNIGIRPYWLPDDLHELFFAQPGKAEHYAEKIVNLLQSPLNSEQRLRMQEKARQYTPQHLAHEFQKLITES